MANSTGIIAGPKRDLVGYEGNPPKVSWPGGAQDRDLAGRQLRGRLGAGDRRRRRHARAGRARSWPLTKRDLGGRRRRSSTARAPATGGCSTSSTSRTSSAPSTPAPSRWSATATPPGDARARPRRHVARLALGGRLAADRERGARAHPPRGRLDRRDDGRAAARLVLPLRAERATRASWSSRRAASSTTATPTTTTCRTGRWSAARSTWSIPYSLGHQRRQVQLGRLRLAGDDFEKYLKANFDRLYKEGADASQDDVDRPAHASGRPSRPRRRRCANFIEYAKSHPDVWFARRIDIARHWMAHHA